MPGPDLPSFHGIIGRSAAMQTLFRKIELAAPADVPVLIQGESGTGKELVARVVQRLSARKERGFEPINCADFSSELLATELAGIFNVAKGGTVFLDEVGDLAPAAQAMLLRVLETGEGRPVGSTRTIRADVRLIAATHGGLDPGGGTGTLRLDLYYQLRGVLLELPPLRERSEDIPQLIEHYRRVINARHDRLGMAVEGVRPRAMAALQAYDWPGNVRELAAVLEQAMIFQRSGWLEPEDLGLPAPAAERRPFVDDEVVDPIRVDVRSDIVNQ